MTSKLEARRTYQREYMRRWRAANPERVREINQQADARRPAWRKQYARNWHLQKKYGLTPDQIPAEGEPCNLCHVREWKHVDHDHRTGAVRGFLCRECNLLLGYADDVPGRLEQASAYLHVDQ